MTMVVEFDDKELAQFLQLFPAEARKAGLYGLNDAAKVMQATVRGQMAQRFTYRGAKGRTFLERQVKIAFYKAGQPEQVRVFTAGPNVEPDRQLLPKFDAAGGTKQDRQGGMLTIPIRARPSKGQVVPKRFRISDLQLRRGPGDLLHSATQKGVWADRKHVYRRTGRGRSTKVEVLYTFRRAIRVPTPIRWNVATDQAVAQWPAIAGRMIAEKAAHLMRTGRASADSFETERE